MASTFEETLVVQSTVLSGGGARIITVRRQSLAGIGWMLVVVAALPLCLGTVIATSEATLAVKSGMFVISPVFCMVTGALTLNALKREDGALMDIVEKVGVLSALLCCVTAVLNVCDLMNYMGDMNGDEKVPVFSGISFILSLLEMALCGMVSGSRCMMNRNSANALTVAHLFGASTVTTQTPPAYQTPPTTQTPPAYQTPPTTQTPPAPPPSASWSPPFPPVAPPPEYERPPSYNSIVT